MPDSVQQLAVNAFATLLANEEVDLFAEENEIHIAGDDWTLVLIGDPVKEVVVALEDEGDSSEAELRSAFDETALAAVRDLNDLLRGELIIELSRSPDPLANALAALLRD